jgi:hypothetical protein
MVKNHGRFLRAALIILALPIIASCRPCGCSECDMNAATRAFVSGATGLNVTNASFHFDYNFWPSDDGFTLDTTYVPAGGGAPVSEQVSGTYHQSGDTVTFKAKGGTSKIIQNDVVYTVTCVDKQLKFHRPGAVQDLVLPARTDIPPAPREAGRARGSPRVLAHKKRTPLTSRSAIRSPPGRGFLPPRCCRQGRSNYIARPMSICQAAVPSCE